LINLEFKDQKMLVIGQKKPNLPKY